MARSRSSVVATAVAAAFLLAPAAIAQSGNRGTMVMDDGQGRYVLHYAEPNVDLAVRPDVAPTDLPLFTEELTLSEPQREAVRHLIDEYMVAFEELLRTRHPDPEADADDGVGEPGAVVAVADDRDPVRDIIADELRNAGFDVGNLDDFPYRPSVQVGMGIDQRGDGPPVPSVDVAVSFGGDDDSMTEEMRDRLQAVADRITPRLAEHAMRRLEERMAGDGPGAVMGGDARAQIERRWREIQTIRTRIREFVAAKRALFTSFKVGVQALLAEPQIEAWPAFERAFTRVKTLPLGRLAGESTDLVAVADETVESLGGEARELLAAYAMELHPALERRNRLLATVDGEIDEALFEGDTASARAAVARITRARVAIRDLNDRYASAIAAALPEGEREAFRQAALAEGYPRIFRQTQAQEAFDRAARLDLSGEVAAAIADLRIEYSGQLAALNERLYRSVRRHQADRLENEIENAIEVIEGGNPGPPPGEREIMDGFRTRQALDARTMRSMYALLTPEQLERMPRLPETDVAEPVVSEHYEGEADD